jgi:hypothetical protein
MAALLRPVAAVTLSSRPGSQATLRSNVSSRFSILPDPQPGHRSGPEQGVAFAGLGKGEVAERRGPDAGTISATLPRSQQQVVAAGPSRFSSYMAIPPLA